MPFIYHSTNYFHSNQYLQELYIGSEEVRQSYAALTAALRQANLPTGSLETIEQAVRFAAEKHLGQTRKNKDQSPYIIHPIGVCRHLLEVGKVTDPEILTAALLHDTVEDTGTSFEEILCGFGPVVEGYIRELTDDKSLPKEERKRLQIEHAPHKSPGAAMIKLSDKHYNLTDLSRETPVEWSQERVDAYFAWAKEVVDALPEVNPALKGAVDELIAAHR